MFKVTFASKAGALHETLVDAAYSYEARKAVAARQDYEIFIACAKATPEDIARLQSAQPPPAPGGQGFEAWEEQRRAAADGAYQVYEFGRGVEVEDAGGWERLSHGNEWTRPVFVRTDEGDDVGSSQRLVFTVRFAPASATLAEAYAIDSKGSIWGAMPDESVGDVVSDVLERARKYGFTPHRGTVRELVEESAQLLRIELDEAQTCLTCARVMGADEGDLGEAYARADTAGETSHG